MAYAMIIERLIIHTDTDGMCHEMVALSQHASWAILGHAK